MSTLTIPMLAALKAELANDPAARGYAGKSANEQAALLNAPFAGAAPGAVAVAIPLGLVEGYLRARFFMTRLQAYASASPPAGASPQAVEAASELLGMIASPHTATVDMTDPVVAGAVAASLAALAAEGAAGRFVNLAGQAFGAANVADLLALGAHQAAAMQTHPRVMDVFMTITDAPNVVTADDVVAAVAS